MKFKILLLFCLLNIHNLTQIKAQKKLTDAHLTGHVTDSETGEHLPYVSVGIKGTTIGMMTDATGHFLLKNLPLGKHTLLISHIGYKSLQREVEIAPQKTIEVHLAITPDAFEMSEVVITGSRNESQRRESATMVNVISPLLFEKTASNNAAEALNFLPGLRVEYNCSNCGVPQLRINGLEGQYSQILLDSRPLFSSLASVYSLEQLPVGMIERIEVIRGGGSALYGSNAIGGVANIITKEPLRSSASLSNTTNIFKGGATDVSTTINASIVSDDFRTGLYLFGVVKERDNYDRNGDSFSEIPTLSGETVGFRAYHKFKANSRLTAEYHHMREFRRGGNKFDNPPHESDIAEQLRHNIHGGGLSYDYWSLDNKHRFSLYSSLQQIDRESYFGTQQNINAYGKTDDFTFISGGQYSHTMDKFLFMPSELTLGTEYSNNKLNDKMLGYNRIINQTSTCFGGFLQNEWKTNMWSILVGTRVDKHNKVDDVIFSPRANLRYTPSQMFSYRLSYSSGYRAPQAYDEDMHVAAVGGEVAIISVSPNLRPEYSQSFSGSVDFYHKFGQIETNLLIEGFYTSLDDVFTLIENGHDSQGNLLLERRNASGATVKGINLELKLGFTRKLILDVGFTLQSSRYDTPLAWSENESITPKRKMFRSPDNYGYLTLSYKPTTPLSLSLTANYTGSMLLQHYAGYIDKDEVTKSESFLEMGFKASYNLKLSKQLQLELNAGVKNILDSFQNDLDAGINKDAGYIYGPVFPRTFFLGAKFSI